MRICCWHENRVPAGTYQVQQGHTGQIGCDSVKIIATLDYRFARQTAREGDATIGALSVGVRRVAEQQFR
jgi:hypothetical protein